jgi:hypothetical protein
MIDEATRSFASDVLERMQRARDMIDELARIRRSDALASAACSWLLLVLADGMSAIGDLLTDAGPPAPATKGKPDARANRDHRHRFNAAGVCEVCGKPRAANGRKPAAAAGAPPPDTRTVPIPFKPNLEAADRHADGGLGSSGMRR